MKRTLLACLVLLATPALAQQSVPAIEFESVPDFPKLPKGMNFGEVPGVAVNSKGSIFVFTRSNSAKGPAYAPAAAQLLEFDRNGEFVGEIGKGLYAWSFAHTVRIDKRRQHLGHRQGLGHDHPDSIRQGRVVWVFGRRKESADEHARPWEHVQSRRCRTSTGCSASRPTSPGTPTATPISATATSTRASPRSTSDGDWVKSWGEKGTGPGPVPHAARHRGRPQQQHLCGRPHQPAHPGVRHRRQIPAHVHDRRAAGCRTPSPVNGNTPTGAAPRAGDRRAQLDLHHARTANQVMFVGESTFPGRIFKVSLDGKVLGVIGKSGRNLKQFSGAHQLACPSENEIYAAETSNWRVQKLLLKPTTN